MRYWPASSSPRRQKSTRLGLPALLVLAALGGCSMLATREAAIGCQVADIATTYRALHLSAAAYEANPIPLPILLAVKIAIIVWVWTYDDWNKEPEGARATLAVVGCLPVPGNLKAAKG